MWLAASHTPSHAALLQRLPHNPNRNYFRCDINETTIREVVDAIVDSGLRDAGYTYVNIGGGPGDGWRVLRACEA